MERVTKNMIESKVEYLNDDYNLNLNIGYAYGGVKIESNDGSIDISCRGTKAEKWHFWKLSNIL